MRQEIIKEREKVKRNGCEMREVSPRKINWKRKEIRYAIQTGGKKRKENDAKSRKPGTREKMKWEKNEIKKMKYIFEEITKLRENFSLASAL